MNTIEVKLDKVIRQLITVQNSNRRLVGDLADVMRSRDDRVGLVDQAEVYMGLAVQCLEKVRVLKS